MKTFKCNELTNRVPMAEAVGNGLGDTEHLHRNPLNHCGRHIFSQQPVRKPDNAQCPSVISRAPVVVPNSQPDKVWKLIGQIMKDEG